MGGVFWVYIGGYDCLIGGGCILVMYGWL